MNAMPLDGMSGVQVLERGWLSSNNVLLQGGESPAVLVDASHVLHAGQTLALVETGLRGEPLGRLVNTHLHSDHCGGNAALQKRFGCRLSIPPGEWDAVQRWDEQALSYRHTGQLCRRFVADDRLQPSDVFEAAGRIWQALAAPGHDPHSLILFDARHGVLISADALWQNGFGVVFPELEGEPGFEDVGAVLDLIERLDPRWVIPGHGAVFSDVADALQRARRRLRGLRDDPRRHAAHAARVLIKYHLLEEQQQAMPQLLAWWTTTPLAQRVWALMGHPCGSLAGFGERVLGELAASGAVRRDGVLVLNA